MLSYNPIAPQVGMSNAECRLQEALGWDIQGQCVRAWQNCGKETHGWYNRDSS